MWLMRVRSKASFYSDIKASSGDQAKAMTTGQLAISHLDQAIPVTVKLQFFYARDFYRHAGRQFSAFHHSRTQVTDC